MTKSPYPVPREDADNAEFLEAWRSGRLLLPTMQLLRQVDLLSAAAVVRIAGRTASRAARRAAEGRIVSYSLVYRPNDPAFNDEVPIVLAEVELAEGASFDRAHYRKAGPRTFNRAWRWNCRHPLSAPATRYPCFLLAGK